MVIIETCPECGHDLIDIELTTYPPIPSKHCTNCGWSWQAEREDIVRIPFDPNKQHVPTITILNAPLHPSDVAYDSSPCVHCSNNPVNGGSGICHCTLGQKIFY